MATQSAKRKEKQPPEPFFNELISVYFQFCEEKFNQRPTFDGSAPRDFKQIIIALRKRAELISIEWTFGVAEKRLRAFLLHCYGDNFIRSNFLLHIINRQKDKIFFSLQPKSNNG